MRHREKGRAVTERHWIIEKVFWNKSAGVSQGCIDLKKETRRCTTLGKGFCYCFSRRRKVMDIIKINKDSVSKREIYWERNDGSSTEVTTNQVVKKPHKGWGRVLFLSLQENTHLQKVKRPWTSRCLKRKRWDHQAKRTITYEDRSYYNNSHDSLKNQSWLWSWTIMLFFSKPKHVVKRKI